MWFGVNFRVMGESAGVAQQIAKELLAERDRLVAELASRTEFCDRIGKQYDKLAEQAFGLRQALEVVEWGYDGNCPNSDCDGFHGNSSDDAPHGPDCMVGLALGREVGK